MACTIRGWLPRMRLFLPGTPLEFARAGIQPSIFGKLQDSLPECERSSKNLPLVNRMAQRPLPALRPPYVVRAPPINHLMEGWFIDAGVLQKVGEVLAGEFA